MNNIHLPTRSEILYNRRLSEEDRQREIKRQRAYKGIRATASLYRRLPVEPDCFYHNSNGDRVGISSLPISLC